MVPGLQVATERKLPLNALARDGMIQPYIHRSWGINTLIVQTQHSRHETQIITVIQLGMTMLSVT